MTVHRIAVLLRTPAAYAALWVAAFSASATEADEKRRDPPEVPPVVVGDMRYEAVLFGQPYGYQQDGGIVIARRTGAGGLEWTRRIYGVSRGSTSASYKQDVFITSMTLSADRKRLVIANERGQRFELNLDGGRVRELVGRVQ